ncbi:MFS transporter [Actinoplanes sp. NBRC 101535]|uniref:MFS transporter n=1 Tax=Actinoplanes sp. NBRC 101535 TaxID=3032196 RepID=UPI0024A19F01|nr:MFS transporter [Actinoplanes sp. NBRC 101535]GLY06621.1 EmrB/QacA family drug resistance transporter [Actinoplanes sp. NBRC 101535]
MSADRRLLAPLSGLLLVLFVATLSSTVISTALPQMLDRLNGSPAQLTWVVTVALLTATASTPIWGKLADLYSKKTLIHAAIVVFVAGSLAAGLSQNVGSLIAARAVQGAGVGGLQALAQIAIAAMIPPRERGRYSGYLSSTTALSTIGGPLLGGLIVDTSWLGWRWCFFIGIPVAVAALIVLQATLRIPVVPRERVRIDYLGAMTMTAGVGLLLVWVSFAGDAFAWWSRPSVLFIMGALGLLAFAGWVEARAAEPILPLRILRQRTTALAILGSLAAGTAMYGAAVFLTQYFQLARGFSPTSAGLLTIPMMAGILVTSLVGGRLVSRTGQVKPFLVTGAVLLAAGLGLLGLTEARTPLVLMGVGMLAVGAGIGLTMQNFVLVVQNTVPLRDIGTASSTIAFFRSLGGTVGVSVLGAIYARGLDTTTTDNVAYGNATGTVFLISAAVAVLGIVAAVSLRPVSLRTSLDLPQEPQATRG